VAARSATLQAPEGNIRLDAIPGNPFSEVISVRIGNDWVPALSAQQSATRVVISGHPADSHLCIINSVSTIPDGELLSGDCGVGSFEEHILLSSEPDVLNVSMQFTVNPGVEIVSVEDRYDFAPGRRLADSPLGPIDFVWSQNIKNEADGDIPNWSFKSPAVMLQQGRVFTALMPTLSDRRSDPLALDLDVTSNPLPWLAYGAISSQPYGHSYFRRSTFGSPRIIQAASQSGDRGHIEYQYSIVASDQPYKLGYRSVVRRLWSDEGHAALLRSSDLQQNVLRPQLATFEDWASDTWIRYANQVYVGFDCGQRRCGTLASFRNPWGHWDQSAPDAWFNPWFETLRTAYGWYLYGSRTNNKDIQAKSESVLNLALSSPRDGGAFSTIYLVNNRSWVHSDGWAGFSDDYHAFAMSWTAYWMLKWAEDLDPGREQEVLEFTRPYGDFLIQHQLPNGNIPAWFDSQMKPREEFRDFNAETAASALFLAQLYQHTRNQAYLDAARKAMDFITREVLPRQRWFDYETFLSCARKPFSFYDPWTAQYPQNNLSQIQAAEAYLKLFQITNDPKYLSTGTHVLDYLLLTQQVWNNPALSPKMVGGFTTQNTDAEWSDAREAYAAVLLWRYYQATGTAEYLERAVAAARSIFAVAPWENWAHTGYIDESGSLTGFNWGAGSGMASVEMMFPKLGDAFVDLKNRSAVGFNACSIRNLRIENNTISFDLDVFADKLPTKRTIAVRFADIDKDAQYRIIWNEHPSGLIAGATLIADGFTIRESK
jgi:hypothetical protein